MHSGIWIWQLVVHVLILETNTVHVVVLHIVEDGHVIVDVASPIEVLWQKVEPDIVPVRWLDLIGRKILVSEILTERKLGDLGVQESHLPLEELILTSVIIGVLISHSKS